MVTRRQFLRGNFGQQALAEAAGLRIDRSCLAARQIVCRSCAEACAEGAIRFAAAPGGAALPRIEAALCTGCGDCIGVCPARAIQATLPEGATT